MTHVGVSRLRGFSRPMSGAPSEGWTFGGAVPVRAFGRCPGSARLVEVRELGQNPHLDKLESSVQPDDLFGRFPRSVAQLVSAGWPHLGSVGPVTVRGV